MKLSTYFEITKLIGVFVLAGFFVFSGITAYNWVKAQFILQEQKLKLELEAQRRYFELRINEVRANTTIIDENSKIWKEELIKLKEQNQELLALIKKNNEKIINIGKITTKTNENLSLELHKLSDHVYKVGTGDKNEQYFKKIYMKEKTKDGKEIKIPIAWAIFYPNRPLDKQWKTGIYPLEFKTKIIQAEQEDGQWNTYIETWAENNKDKESRGIKLPLTITVADFKQIHRETEKFYWWAPHFNLNLDFALTNSNDEEDTSIYGGLSFSLSGYGRTKNDLVWKFIDFGVCTNRNTTYLKVTPFLYNLADSVPFINNLFVGPFVGMSNYSDYIFGVGINLSL